MVGLILLVGIVVNNAIILIEFINQERARGVERKKALINSVTLRFRPIMMTSFSTVVGMIPLSLELALGSERFSPLATAIIGGMTAATFLTMIVVPVFYDVFDSMSEKLSKIGAKK
ncbi:MAG TPA: efflux RND transporter permease subunit, partial [bacterium]|nr:efflux RND transporter permease subunit [bacterium]